MFLPKTQKASSKRALALYIPVSEKQCSFAYGCYRVHSGLFRVHVHVFCVCICNGIPDHQQKGFQNSGIKFKDAYRSPILQCPSHVHVCIQMIITGHSRGPHKHHSLKFTHRGQSCCCSSRTQGGRRILE